MGAAIHLVFERHRFEFAKCRRHSSTCARRTNVSRRTRYSISALIVTIFNPCALANLDNSGTRDMVPSWFMISQITAAGLRPGQSRQIYRTFGLPRAASTPPLCAFKGKIGRAGKIRGLNFWDRWRHESSSPDRLQKYPVVIPRRASTDTVNAVPKVGRIFRV